MEASWSDFRKSRTRCGAIVVNDEVNVCGTIVWMQAHTASSEWKFAQCRKAVSLLKRTSASGELTLIAASPSHSSCSAMTNTSPRYRGGARPRDMNALILLPHFGPQSSWL